MTPDSKPRRVLPTPRGAMWLGIGLTVVGLAAQWLSLLAAVFQEAPQQPALNAIFWVMNVLQGIALPLGVAFLAFTLVARAVVRTETLEVENDDDEQDDEEREPAPRVFSSRVVLISGIVLVVVGFALSQSLRNWVSSAASDPGLWQDFVFYILPLLEPVLLPLGIVLIPCAWLLRLLESRSVLSAIH